MLDGRGTGPRLPHARLRRAAESGPRGGPSLGSGGGSRSPARDPHRPQGQHDHPGDGDHRRLEDPGRLPPSLRRHRGPTAPGGRGVDHRQGQPRRVRHGVVDRELGLRPYPQPVAHRPRSRRVVGRQRGGRGCSYGPRRAGFRHGRVDPPARLPLRHRGGQAHLRSGEPLRTHRLRVLPRPDRPADPHGQRCRPPPRHGERARPARRHVLSR